MTQSGIVYQNLRAEMARNRITIKTMSERLCMNRDTLARKLSGKSPLYLDEAVRIQKAFFEGIEVNDLFATDDEICKEGNSHV